MTTPLAEPNRSVSSIDRRAAMQAMPRAMPRGEAGVRGHAGVVSPRALGLWSDFAVTASTSTIERAYRVRLCLKPAQERQLLRLLAAGTGPGGRPLRTSVGRTRRSRGTDARGEGACAAGKTSPAGQPTSMNREPAYRAAQPRTTRQRQVGPARRVEG